MKRTREEKREWDRNYYERNKLELRAKRRKQRAAQRASGQLPLSRQRPQAREQSRRHYERHKEAIRLGRKLGVSIPEARRLIAEMDAKRNKKNGRNNPSQETPADPTKHSQGIHS